MIKSSLNYCLFCSALLKEDRIFTSSRNNKSYSYFKCSQCKSLSLLPVSSSKTLENAYSDTYYGEKKEKFIPIVNDLFNFLKVLRAKACSKRMREGARVLDIGCGAGAFLEKMQHLGFEIHGTEIPGKVVSRASEVNNMNLHIGFFEQINFECKFELITLWHVIEHLKNPKEVLTKSFNLCHENGTIVIALPNVESNQFKLFKKNWFHLDPPRHLCLAPRKAIVQHMEKLGCSLIQEKKLCLEYDVFGYIQSFINIFEPKRDDLYEKLKGNFSNPRLSHLILLVLIAPLAFLISIFESFFSKASSMELTFEKN